MEKEVATLPAHMRVGELAERTSRYDPDVVHHHGFVLVDSDGKLAGVITRKTFTER